MKISKSILWQTFEIFMKFSFVPRSASGWTRWPTRWREAWGSWTSASRASSPSPPTWKTSPTRFSSTRSLRWYLATFVFMSQSCQVPPSWAKLAYASLNGLSAWYDHFYTKLIDLKASCSRWYLRCEDLSWWKKQDDHGLAKDDDTDDDKDKHSVPIRYADLLLRISELQGNIYIFLRRSFFCHNINACNIASLAILMFVSFCKHFHHSVWKGSYHLWWKFSIIFPWSAQLETSTFKTILVVVTVNNWTRQQTVNTGWPDVNTNRNLQNHYCCFSHF